jgi:hypothetical protein
MIGATDFELVARGEDALEHLVVDDETKARENGELAVVDWKSDAIAASAVAAPWRTIESGRGLHRGSGCGDGPACG